MQATQNQIIMNNKNNAVVIMILVFGLFITIMQANTAILSNQSEKSTNNANTKPTSKSNNKLIKDCENGYINACISLAKNSKAYQDKIIAILKRSCQIEYQSCLILAEMYNTQSHIPQNLNMLNILNSKGVKHVQYNYIEDFIGFIDKVKDLNIPLDNKEALKYQEKAIPLIENACYSRANQDLQACLILSYFYEKAIAVPLNRPKANRLVESVLDSFMRECVINNKWACLALSQYRDYLAMINSEIPTIERECDEKDSTSCFRASLYYTQDFYIPMENGDSNSNPNTDFVKSAYFLKKGCSLESELCENGIFKIPYAKACIMDNDMEACTKVKSDKPEFLSLSCNDGNIASCYALRYLPQFEEKRRFIALAQRACKSGIVEACGELARRYKMGDNVSQNDDKALSFTQRACNWELKQGITISNNSYCYDTAYGYEVGDFVKQDINKAMELYNYSCSFDPNACARLARLYEIYKKQNQTAIKLYKYACDNGSNEARSCIKVANHYFTEASKGQDPIFNIVYAIEYSQKSNSIDRDYAADSLYQLGSIYALDNFIESNNMTKTKIIHPNPYTNYALAAKYFEESCIKGLFESCELYEQYGEKKQSELYQLCKAEDNKNTNSCYQLVLYDIIPSSKTKKNHNARKIMNNLLESCTKDLMPACAFVIRLSNIQEYEKHLNSKNIAENLPLQDKLCTVSKDKTYDMITLNNDMGIFCANIANYAYDNKDYLRFIRSLEGYDYNFIANTIPIQDVLDKLVLAYFETQQYAEMIKLYRYIYENGIPNSYYFLALAYQQGLGVTKDLDKAIEIYNLGIKNEEDSKQNLEFKEFALSYFGLSQSYEMGLGVPKDSYKSMELLRLSCPLNKRLDSHNTVAKACAILGKESTKEGDLEEAKEYYQRACDAKYDGDIIFCKNIKKPSQETKET